MLNIIIILISIIVLSSCSTPTDKQIAVFNDQETYNKEIFPENSAITSNCPVDAVVNETESPEINANIISGSKEQLQKVLSKPMGIIIDSAGYFYIADQQNNKIVKFDSRGQYIKEWGSFGSDQSEFNEPKYMSFMPDGNILVSDTWNGRIQQFNKDGKFIKDIKNDFFGPKGVVTANRLLYVSDTGHHCIKVFDLNGKFLTKIGRRGEGQREFNEPTDLTSDTNGNIYIIDSKNNRIQVIDKDNKYKTAWNIAGWTDKEKGKECWIKVYDNKLYLSDYITNKIRVFDLNGKELAPFIENISSPSGMYIYKDSLYICLKDGPGLAIKKLK